MVASWTPKLARARSLRRIKAFESALAKMTQGVAYEWADDDQSICYLCDELVADCEARLKELREALDDHVETHTG